MVLVAGLALPTVAWADDPGFIDQYEEPFPTGGGNDHSGGGGSGGGNIELPGYTQSQLESSVPPSVAEALDSVATSPELGAPQWTFDGASGRASARAGATAADASAASFPSALSTSAEAENPYLVAVLLGLVATTLVGAAAFAFRRRRSSPP